MKEHISRVVIEGVDQDAERRGEALADFLSLSAPGMSETERKRLAGLVPQVPRSLYLRWVELFVGRLLETIPADQLQELCNGQTSNNATLRMVYLMFMESERMEKQVADDLADWAEKNASETTLNGAENGLSREETEALSMLLAARMRHAG